MSSPKSTVTSDEMAKFLRDHNYSAVLRTHTQPVLSPMDFCVVRGAIGGVLGGGLGVGFGLLMHMTGPMGGMGAMPIPGQPQFNVPPPPAPAATPAHTTAAPRGTALTGSIGTGASAASANIAASSTAAAVPAVAASSSATASSATTASARSVGAGATTAAFAPPAGLRPTGLSGLSSMGPMPRPIPVLPAGLGVADPIYGQSHTPELSSWQQVRTGLRDTGRMAKGNFKTWGLLSGTYAFSECKIEQWRGRSDELNPVLAGCTTGALLAARSGPQGMAIGCASFAAFSFAMEKVMHSM